MVSFGVNPVALYDLLGYLEDRGRLSIGLPPTSVFLTLASEDALARVPPSDQFVAINPHNLQVWQSVVTGAGFPTTGFTDGATGFDSSVRISIFVRLQMDKETIHSNLLRSPYYGLPRLFQKVLRCYQGWTCPKDGDPSISYLREPMRISQGPTLKMMTLGKDRWSVCTTGWEVRYTMALTNPPEPPT